MNNDLTKKWKEKIATYIKVLHKHLSSLALCLTYPNI